MEQQIASSGKESCVVCHGVAREFSVEKMHRKGREWRCAHRKARSPPLISFLSCWITEERQNQKLQVAHHLLPHRLMNGEIAVEHVALYFQDNPLAGDFS
jgi:hypothetical protein